MKNTKIEQISLDNASSVAVPLSTTKRKINGSVMYEIEYKGVKIRSDNLEGAKELLRQIQGLPDAPESKPWSREETLEFLGRLRPGPKDILYNLMFTMEPSRSDSFLRSELGIPDNRTLAGILSGISKTALSMKIPPERVYRQTTTYHEGKPIRHYSLTLVFREALEKYANAQRFWR